MKIWPFVLTFGLIGGNYYADSQNVGRESKPHSRPKACAYTQTCDTQITLSMPHRVATFAIPAMFRIENIIGDGQDWTKPEGEARAETTEDDPDAGQDPGKKLFWTHSYPGVYDPAPFPGWGYSVPDRSPISAPACGDCRPGNNLTIIYTYTDNESERSTRTETMAVSQPTFLDAQTLKFISDTISGNDKVVDDVTIDPVTGEKHHHFHHHHDTIDPTDPTSPTDPILTGPTDPVGPIKPPITGVGSIGGAVGMTVPEPSTWITLAIGFIVLAYAKRRKTRWQHTPAIST